jgi:hypothetical protein
MPDGVAEMLPRFFVLKSLKWFIFVHMFEQSHSYGIES